MKYLYNREKFINQKLDEAFSAANTGGPGANNVNWGDSLVGRLINSFRRKVGVGSNLVRINQVIKQLKNQFEDILFYSKSNSISEEDRQKIANIVVYDLMVTLNVAILDKKNNGYAGEENIDSGDKTSTTIEDKNYLSEILVIINDIIKTINDMSKNGYSPSNEKEILSSLSEILSEVKNMKDNFGEIPNKEEKEDTKILVKNDPKESFEVGKYYGYKNKEGETLIVYITKSGENNTGHKWNKETNKWSATTITMLNTKSIIKEIKIDDKILNNEDVKSIGLDSKDIPLFPKRPNLNVETNPVRSVATVEKKISDYKSFIKENIEFDTKDPEFGEDVDKKSEVNIENQDKILSEKWLSLWNSKIVKLVLTKEAIDKMKIDMDKISMGNNESKDSITIQGGKDPIIGILRCFNRAYKLHTTQVIPSGRSGGQVSNRTFREYISFGGGTPDNAGHSGGPYRNIIIFDKWENGVMDILEDRKYQPIFHKDTKLQVGDKIVNNVGPIIKKMIVDLLDGDKLYKGDTGGGAQKQFLDKYFNFGDIKSQEMGFSSKEVDDITDIANKTPDPISIRFSELKSIPEKIGNIIFKVTNKTKEVSYINVVKIDSNYAYLIYSNGFGTFRKYLENYSEKNKTQYSFGNLRSLGEGDLFLTKIKYSSVKDILNKVEKTLSGVNPNGESNDMKINAEYVEYLIEKKNLDEKDILLRVESLFKYKGTSKGFKEEEISKAKESK